MDMADTERNLRDSIESHMSQIVGSTSPNQIQCQVGHLVVRKDARYASVYASGDAMINYDPICIYRQVP